MSEQHTADAEAEEEEEEEEDDDDTPVGRVFRKQVNNIFIDPRYLEAVREVSNRGLSVTVEEARWYDTFQHDQTEAYERVVVLSFRPNFIANNAELAEVIESSRRLNALQHTNVIRLLGLGCYRSSSQADVRSSLFYVEQFGGAWSMYKMLRCKRLHRQHPHVQFTTRDAMRWIVGIAEGLAYLHANKIVHRDLKAESILLSDDDVADTIARVGELRPHCKTFRRNAPGHSFPPPEPEPSEPSADLVPESTLRSSLTIDTAQMSLASFWQSRSRRFRGSEAGPASGPVSADIRGAGAGGGGGAVPKLQAQLSLSAAKPNTATPESHAASAELRALGKSVYAQEALPLQVSQVHHDLAGKGSFFAALQDKVKDEVVGLTVRGVAGGKMRRLSALGAIERAGAGTAGEVGTTVATVAGAGGPEAAPAAADATAAPAAAAAAAPAEIAGAAVAAAGGSADVGVSPQPKTLKQLRTQLQALEDSGGAEGPGRPADWPHPHPVGPEAAAADEATGSPGSRGSRLKSFQAPVEEEGEGAEEGERGVRRVAKDKLRVKFCPDLPQGLLAHEEYSLIYAAPEYCSNMCQETLSALTPKADTFSFAILMYEILTQQLINPAAAVTDGAEGWHTTGETLLAYAAKVAEGHREKIPSKWPATISALITQCWRQDPSDRPGMAFVARRLRELSEDEEVLLELEPPPLPPEPEPEVDEEEGAPRKVKVKRAPTGRMRFGIADMQNDEDEDEEDEDEEEGEEGGEGGEAEEKEAAGGAGAGVLNRITVSLQRTSANAASALQRTSANAASALQRNSANAGLKRTSVNGGGPAAAAAAGAAGAPQAPSVQATRGSVTRTSVETAAAGEQQPAAKAGGDKACCTVS